MRERDRSTSTAPPGVFSTGFLRPALPCLLLAAAMTSAHAEDAGKPALAAEGAVPGNTENAPAFMVVRVTGVRAIPWKSYRAMRAAVATYEQYKSLAPDAIFSFAVLAPAGATLPPNFALRVRTRDGQEYPIALENGELFQLPVLPDPRVDADLVSNVKEGPLRIGLLVHTRGVPPEKERLGDVRLRLHINQAIAAVDDPGTDRRCSVKSRWSGCKRPSVTVWHQPRAATSGASIVEAHRREPLEAGGNPYSPAYRMPISGERWGHDALIEFNYRQPLRPLKLSETAVYDAEG